MAMDITGYFQSLWGGAVSGILQGILWFVIIGAGVACFCYWWIKIKPYNVTCHILSSREGGGKYFRDKAAYLTNKDGSKTFKLKRFKTEIPQPNFAAYLIPQPKGNAIWLRQISQKEFVPVSTSDIFGLAGPQIKTLNPNLDFWSNISKKRADSKYNQKGFWEKYGGVMAILATGMMIFLLIVITFRNIGVLQSVAIEFKEVAKELAEVARTMAEIKGVGVATEATTITPPF